MNDFEVFPNAPITEAVLDIIVELPKGLELSVFENFQAKIPDTFNECQSKHSFEAKFQFTPGQEEMGSITPKGRTEGYLYRSTKENKIVQARLNGFAFNKLRPYESWENFRREAKELWELYCHITQPIKVNRIALRYINRIEIPLPLDDFGDYILTNPQVAPSLPQGLSNYFMRVEIPNPEIDALAIILQTMQRPTKSQKLPLIFDIDVIKDQYTDDLTKIWDDFEILRIYKNEIFFESLTDKAKELFK